MVTEKREEMIEGNLGLVHSIAKRFKGRGAEYDDLFQAGCVGLIKAVDNFDESRGFCFSTYAVPVIMGEIKRIFRDGGAIKVGRALKEKSIKAQSIRDKFIKKNLREPTILELSEIMECSPEEMAEILNVLSPMISLTESSEDGTFQMDLPYDNSEEMFDRISLSQVIDELPEVEQKIIDLRYYKGKTQCYVAKELGISQVQVSRKEKTLLKKLRDKLIV